MNSYTLPFQKINRSDLMLAGGKGANLGELSGLEGLLVPDGFCITTEAYKKITANNTELDRLLRELSRFSASDRERISDLSAKIRVTIESIPIPDDIIEAITLSVTTLGEENAFAIRSSATAEDLPSASFAGQQDSYLNIIGRQEILKHISKCWASVFTDRAITYRMQNGFEHREIRIAVVVQKMIFPEASGILFTADPASSNRKIISIDAGFGLGEALVSGLVSADCYKVKGEEIVQKRIATKKLAVYALTHGGTETSQIEPVQQDRQTISDSQILTLARIGRQIETHFGCPQDIEWCIADNKIYILQSRPITTLYPVPEVNDQQNHVYVSVGHQQMMTDPIKPLGLSFYLLTTRAPMRQAGGRLFVDITHQLASHAGRKAVIDTLGKSDPLIKDALINLVDRGDFIKPIPEEMKETDDGQSNKTPSPPVAQSEIESDPLLVADFIKESEGSILALKENIQTKAGTELFAFIFQDIEELKKLLFDPKKMAVIMAAMNASSWINEQIYEWLGEKNAADTLSQSVENNITSEMGLTLMDVADVIRPYPELIQYLQQVKDGNFLEGLLMFDGGLQAKNAIDSFLGRYGMRCVGEIDITKTRWSENPAALVPIILGNIKNFDLKAGRRKFELGRQEAAEKERELLDRLKQLPGGEQKAGETKRRIDLIRNFSGYREYPKYSMVSRYFIYKQALLKEAERLKEANIIRAKEDIYYLGFEAFREVLQTGKLDYEVINRQKQQYKLYEKLIPPRVLTSDGEIITGKYNRDNIPAGALAGLPVSTGVIEGRARVIMKIEDADLEEGDILVTTFTDPSWTTLFVSIKGLVTEVGGLMTHGAVIAREYGLPAVVGVEFATSLITDRQRIRVNGTEGYVEIL